MPRFDGSLLGMSIGIHSFLYRFNQMQPTDIIDQHRYGLPRWLIWEWRLLHCVRLHLQHLHRFNRQRLHRMRVGQIQVQRPMCHDGHKRRMSDWSDEWKRIHRG